MNTFMFLYTKDCVSLIVNVTIILVLCLVYSQYILRRFISICNTTYFILKNTVPLTAINKNNEKQKRASSPDLLSRILKK